MLKTMTSTTLLDGLRDPANEAVWSAWVGRYRPLIARVARRLGLSHDDAEDIAQSTLLSFTVAYREGRYDRDRGKLRSWLFGIAHNEVRQARRRRQAAIASVPLEMVADEGEVAATWEAEWMNSVLEACLEEVRGEVEARTWEAFKLFALESLPADDVAERLGMTTNAVFGAKRRILERIRAVRPLLEDQW